MNVNHDFHIHTNLSFCAKENATLPMYVETAKKLGLKKIGIANHFWDRPIPKIDTYYKTKYDVGFYDNQDFSHISKIKPEIEKYKNEDVKIYFGAEGEYDPIRHGVGITEEVAEQLDFLLVPNSHTHATMPIEYYEPYDKHLQFLIDAYNDILDCPVSKYITGMAHPFSAVACPYPNSILYDLMPDDTLKRLFDKTARKGIAVEINTGVFAKGTLEDVINNPRTHMFDIAKKCGCKFIFGSDAHSDTGHANYVEIINEICSIIGLKDEDITEIAR